MVNGADLIGFFITFGIGLLTGIFFGLMIASLAVISSRDSRERERMEDERLQRENSKRDGI